jgi:hypothetical protein
MRSVARQDVECGLIDWLKIVRPSSKGLARVLAQKDSEGKMKQPSLCRLFRQPHLEFYQVPRQ